MNCILSAWWSRRTASALFALLTPLFVACQTVIQAPPVAPDVDRVGFPVDYQTDYSVYYEFDRPDNKTARVIWANDVAANVGPGQSFPYGSVLVMEVFRTLKDDTGVVLLDEAGRYQRDELAGLFVMRKEPGYGVKYGELRSGEWEYVAYRADNSVLTPPERTDACAACHMEAGLGKDWVFGAHRHAGLDAMPVTPPENTIVAVDYQFVPSTITVTVNSDVTWINQDGFIHTITASDLTFNSGALRPTLRHTRQFEEPGVYDYFCAIHSSMKGQVIVVAP